MTIYLPIAEIPLDISFLLFIGLIGGILAGIFGIGGGFIITPILIFMGVPASVSVASSANQIVASSVTGFLGHLYRSNVDIKMGCCLLIGGFLGAYLGIEIFNILKSIGQIDLAISLIYVVFLGFIGSLMLKESYVSVFQKEKSALKAIEKARLKAEKAGKLGVVARFKLLSKKMPFVIYFPKSDKRISIFVPISVGTISGIMVSLMGIGGGFVMIPAMIYLLKMPPNLVVGTSLFQIIFVTSIVTVMHSLNTQSVDILLAGTLIIGGVIGAQLGTHFGRKLPAEKMRLALSIIILIVCSRLAMNLFIEPNFIYNIELKN